MAAQRVSLIGYWLPPDVECLNLEQAFNLFEAEIQGQPSNWTLEDRHEQFRNILLSLINYNFCQAFISVKFTFPDRTTEELYEVPYPCGGEEGNYLVGLCADGKTASCGDYQGDLVLPADSLRDGLAVFIKQWLPQDEQQRILSARMGAITAKTSLLEGKKQRLEIIRHIVDEAESRARKSGVEFSKMEMPGTKKDLTGLLRRLYKREFLSIRDDTFHAYYSECGLKFRHGSRPGTTNFWKEIFP